MASFTVQGPNSSSSVIRFGSAANAANDQKQQRIGNLASISSYSTSGVPSVRFQVSNNFILYPYGTLDGLDYIVDVFDAA